MAERAQKLSDPAVAAHTRRMVVTMLTGNLGGALLTFVYFRFVDPTALQGTAPVGAVELAYFVAGFSLLFVTVVIMAARWVGPVDAESADAILRNLVLVQLALGSTGLLVSLRLAGNVAGSVVAPLRDLQKAMARVEQLRHGIGIHSGTVVAGNIGSSVRMSYALVGDTVNVASCIQSLNKTTDTHILVSGATQALLRRQWPLRALPDAQVKGRNAAVQVFALDPGPTT